MKAFIQRREALKIDFVIGVPGTGKTTAIKNIITNMRKEGKEDGRNLDVYYFSLRREDKSKIEKETETETNLQEDARELMNLMSAVSNSNKGKMVRFVIDDIN